MLVTNDNVQSVIEGLLPCKRLVVDTETTGLKPFDGCTLFSLAIHDGEQGYYFNFNHYEGKDEYVLPSPLILKPLFDEPRLWIGHNIKFDLHFLAEAGLVACNWTAFYDTMVGARILRNDEISYSLDNCAQRNLDAKKDDEVKAWLDENKAFTKIDVPGKAAQVKAYHYENVPFDLISKYAIKDVELTQGLFDFQMPKFSDEEKEVVQQESYLIKVFYDMERRGIKIDPDFVKAGYSYERIERDKVLSEFKELTGEELVDSGKALAPIFERYGFELPLTFKSKQPDVSENVLRTMDHELPKLVLRFRDHEKRHSYFGNYIYHSDSNDVVHANIRQAGTTTGRLSYMEPNLQNIPSSDDSKFPIRRAFVPRDGYFFLMVDYAQMEFRLLLDYANEEELIRRIKDDGHDPHDATAELTGLTRKAAKTLNFGLLYGMGIKKLGNAIGVGFDESKSFKQKYFQALPRVKNIIYKAQDTQRSRKFVKNWMGRRYYLDDPRFAYRAINSIIQGGCADICKKAMLSLYNELEGTDAHLLVQIHDEVLFEIPNDRVDLIETIVGIMDNAYPYRNMPLTTTAAYSVQSFHDAIEKDSWEDVVSELSAREGFRQSSKEGHGDTAKNMGV
jgi:DNA polymerase-1